MTTEEPYSEPEEVWRLGVTRIFGRHDIEDSALISGWAIPEDQHVWNNGLETVLRILIPDPGRQITLSLECTPFLSDSCPFQDVTLFINGARIHFWHLTEPGIYILDAIVEPRDFRINHGFAALTCVWLLPQSTRPADSGGHDMRELALCFRALTIH